MARVTVEDCIDKVESPYELVLVAKERATQLNSGIEPSLDRDKSTLQYKETLHKHFYAPLIQNLGLTRTKLN